MVGAYRCGSEEAETNGFRDQKIQVYIVSHLCYLNPVWNCASREKCRPLFRFAGNSPRTIQHEKENPLDEFLILLDDC
jgi:hypothetical protein